MLLLAKLLTEELKQPAIPPPTKISPKQAKVSPPEPKIKKEYEDFSDGSDEATTDDMDLESVEHLDSYNMDKDQKGTLKIVHLEDHLKCSYCTCSLSSCFIFSINGYVIVLKSIQRSFQLSVESNQEITLV